MTTKSKPTVTIASIVNNRPAPKQVLKEKLPRPYIRVYNGDARLYIYPDQATKLGIETAPNKQGFISLGTLDGASLKQLTALVKQVKKR